MFLKDFDTPVDRRWSELVPPRTALTFAAIWDEDEGMVTFSGAHLFDSETAEKGCPKSMSSDSPCDVPFSDADSQVLTIDQFAAAVSESTPHCSGYVPPPSAGADSLAFARDAMDTETAMDSRSCLGFGGRRAPPGIHYAPDSPAIASSMALASLANLPFRRTLMHNHHPFDRVNRDSRTSCPEFHDQTDEEVRYCEAYEDSESSDVTDEGFFEDRRLTTGTLGSAPVLVEVNLVRLRVCLAVLSHAVTYMHPGSLLRFPSLRPPPIVTSRWTTHPKPRPTHMSKGRSARIINAIASSR